jgi:hypothetical protein
MASLEQSLAPASEEPKPRLGLVPAVPSLPPVGFALL